MHEHVTFCYIRISLERNTYIVSHAIMICFIMSVSRFISFDEMKELVIMKDLFSSNVRNMLQKKNPDAKEISERSVWRFCTSNNIRKQSNLSKEEFETTIFLQGSELWLLKYLLFMERIHGFGKDHPGYSALRTTLLSL